MGSLFLVSLDPINPRLCRGREISLDRSKKIRPPMYNGDEDLPTASQYKGGISERWTKIV